MTHTNSLEQSTAARLTIIMPIYNGEAFLTQQIDSILSQSVGDFILLAIDDGSTDSSGAIIDDFARRDSRVRRLPSSGNKGQRIRLLELIQAATTKFIAFADQDDVWHPQRNERLLVAIGDKALAFGRSQLIDGEGHDLGRSILEALKIDAKASGPLSTLFHPFVSAHASIVRRDWLDVAAFYGNLPFDHIMGLDAFFSIGLVYVDDAIVYHRIHGGNQMNGSVTSFGAGPWFSRYRLRVSTSFVQRHRLSFFMTLDQMSRSSALEVDVRRCFALAAVACRYTWFQRLQFEVGADRRLERELHTHLGRFASSDRDRDVFTQRVRSMTRGQFSPVNLRNAVKYYLQRNI